MRPFAIRGIDVLAVAGAVAAVGIAVFYLSIIEEQDTGGPAVWFLALLGVAALMCLLAAPLRVRGRAVMLFLAALLTAGLGIPALLSIGGLLLLAGVLPGLAFLLEVLQPDVGRSAR